MYQVIYPVKIAKQHRVVGELIQDDLVEEGHKKYLLYICPVTVSQEPQKPVSEEIPVVTESVSLDVTPEEKPVEEKPKKGKKK